MNDHEICPMSIPCPTDTPLMMCQHEKCAWWDEDAQKCAMLVLAQAMKKVSKK